MLPLKGRRTEILLSWTQVRTTPRLAAQPLCPKAKGWRSEIKKYFGLQNPLFFPDAQLMVSDGLDGQPEVMFPRI